MSQKNTLFNYFQRAKPSPAASSGDKKSTSSGDKKLSLSRDKTPSTNGAKNPPKGHTPTGKPTTNSVTPKRPRPKETKRGSSEKAKSNGTKPYKRLRLISDDEDSENDQSLANGKALESGETAAEPVHSESDGPPDDDSEDEYKREYAYLLSFDIG